MQLVNNFNYIFNNGKLPLPPGLRFGGRPAVGNEKVGGKIVPRGTTPFLGFLPFGNWTVDGKLKPFGNLNPRGNPFPGGNVNVGELGEGKMIEGDFGGLPKILCFKVN